MLEPFNDDPIYNEIPDNLPDMKEGNTGNLEKDLEIESKKVLKRKNQDNLGIILDHNYYFTVYFISEKDKNEFLNKLNIRDLGKVHINGYDLADKLGIKIEKKYVNLPSVHYVKRLKIKSHGKRSRRNRQ